MPNERDAERVWLAIFLQTGAYVGRGITMSPEDKKAWKVIRQKRRSNKDAYDALANYCISCGNCRDAARAFLSRVPGSDRVIDLIRRRSGGLRAACCRRSVNGYIIVTTNALLAAFSYLVIVGEIKRMVLVK